MTPLMAAGIQLMLVGMGTVFFFLTLLVAATHLMSKIALRIAPAASAGSPAPGSLSDEEVAAVTAAIARHRRRT